MEPDLPITDINLINKVYAYTDNDAGWTYVDPAPTSITADKLILNGVDIEKKLNELSRMLGIVQRDFEKEKKYDRLREIAAEYEDELKKLEVFEILKESK